MSSAEYLRKEDSELVRLAKAGDERAESALLDRYKDRVRQRARAYYILGADREDVVQEGMIGLFKAIRSFDEEGGASFGTYAALCCDRQIMDAVRKAARRRHEPLNASVPLESAGEAQDLPADGAQGQGELLPTPEEVVARIPEVLSGLENEVFHLYMEGKESKEIAEALGKSPKTVYNAMVRVKRKIRDLFR